MLLHRRVVRQSEMWTVSTIYRKLWRYKKKYHKYHRSIFQDLHPYISVPSLPSKLFFWMSNSQTKLSELSTFLAKVISCQDLLSNKALHLFLQTELCIDHIQQNLEGLRDDQIKRTNVTNLKGLFKVKRRKTFKTHLDFIKETGAHMPNLFS